MVDARFSWPAVAAKTEAMYDAVISASKRWAGRATGGYTVLRAERSAMYYPHRPGALFSLLSRPFVYPVIRLCGASPMRWWADSATRWSSLRSAFSRPRQALSLRRRPPIGSRR